MDIIEDIINYCDKEILNWADEFHLKTFEYAMRSGNESAILYERTLSSRMNDILYKFINKRYSDCFMVNEFYIRNKTFSKDEIDDLTKDVGIKDASKKKWLGYCVFDGYFYLDNGFRFSIDSKLYCFKHLFVEYKLNHRFIYIDLATDYLKFKLFTRKVSNESGFTYVIFDKKESKPSVKHFPLYDGKNYYIIGKTIGITSIPKVNVYVYYPPKGKKHDMLTEEVVLVATKLKGVIDEINEIESVFLFNESNKKIFDISDFFDKRAITSKIILINFQYIKNVWEESNKKNLFSEMLNQNSNYWCKKESNFNKQLESFFDINSKDDYKRYGLNALYRTSLNYLVLIDCFCYNYLEIDKHPNYSFEKGDNDIM